MEVSKCWKIVEFPKISIKMKNFKTFSMSQTASRLEEIIQSPPNKSFLRLWSKNILTEIYRNIPTFAFQVLRECSPWTPRNSVVQKNFKTNQKHFFAGKFLKVFGCVAGVYFYNVERVEVRKMSEVFWAKS